MPTYLTVKEMADIFRTTEKTIRRWIDEERDFLFDGRNYLPKKDPGGNWLFKVVTIAGEGDMLRSAPVGPRPRRRILSPGIK